MHSDVVDRHREDYGDQSPSSSRTERSRRSGGEQEAPAGPVIDFAQVGLRRGSTEILRGVNWRAHRGEHWAILGPNGAGKTSLIRLVSGYLFPSSGTVQILGETLGDTDITELKQRVGLCSSSLRPQLRDEEQVRDVILSAAWGLLGRGTYELEDLDRQRGADLARIFGVDHLLNRSFVTLSEGEQQRVMIARAMMSDPEILILDEPAAGLDLGAREELLAACTELCAYPRSPLIILVTHHVEEIPIGFTHALLMKEGAVVSSGTSEEVLTNFNLSEIFGVKLRLGQDHGRWWARAETD